MFFSVLHATVLTFVLQGCCALNNKRSGVKVLQELDTAAQASPVLGRWAAPVWGVIGVHRLEPLK